MNMQDEDNSELPTPANPMGFLGADPDPEPQPDLTPVPPMQPMLAILLV